MKINENKIESNYDIEKYKLIEKLGFIYDNLTKRHHHNLLLESYEFDFSANSIEGIVFNIFNLGVEE